MFKVGIIGYGKIGQLRAKLVRNSPLLELDSVCELSDLPLSILPECPVFKTPSAVLDRTPHIVFVCTSNDVIAEIVIQSLDRGCHVFAEKPPGRTVEETRRMIAAERRNPHLKLKFGFNHRYHDSVVQAKRLIDSGRLGNVLSVRGIYGKSGSLEFEKEWRNQMQRSGGGILLDQGIHMLDLMLLFCHEFTEIHSFVDALFWDIEVEDNAFVLMRNQKGQIGMLLSSATQWKHTFDLIITLTEGYIALNGILSGSRSYGRESLTVARKTYEQERMGNPNEENYFFDQDHSWERELEEFLDCIQKDRPVQIGSSADALNAIDLVYRIYRADPKWWESRKDSL